MEILSKSLDEQFAKRLMKELTDPNPTFEAEWRAELGLRPDESLPEPLVGPCRLGDFLGFEIIADC